MSRQRGGGNDFLDALPSDGERRLMLAVLIDAIRALRRHRPTADNFCMSRAWLRDRAWLKAEDHSQAFSFVNICNALGLEADYVRRCVLGAGASQQQLKVRRYAARVEESWLRQRKDGMGGLVFGSRPEGSLSLTAGQS
jgi:hypothetical protein